MPRRPRQPISKKTERAILKLYRKGEKLIYIAVLHRVSTSFISNLAKRNGLGRRMRKPLEQVQQEVAA